MQSHPPHVSDDAEEALAADEPRASKRWESPAAFARRSGLSRNSVYAGIRDRVIPAVRVGRRILVPVDALDRMLTASDEADDRSDHPGR